MGTEEFRQTFDLSNQNIMVLLQKALEGFSRGLLFLICVHFHQKNLPFRSTLVDLTLETCRGPILIFNWCVRMNFLLLQAYERQQWMRGKEEQRLGTGGNSLKLKEFL